MISISLNGEPHQINDGIALTDAISQWGYGEQLFAVAINDTFVARNKYHQIRLNDGDRIDIVSPMQGG